MRTGRLAWALAAGALAAVAMAGVAQGRGHRSGAPHAPRPGGGRHGSATAEIKPIRALGPDEFRPYAPAKPLKPFSYLDHERRGRKAP